MKKIKFLASLMFIMAATAGLTACSDDDEGGSEFDVPAFDASAAKYEISSSNSPYASVEFTESGNYIIVSSDYTAQAPAYAKASGNRKGRMAVLAKSMLVKAKAADTRTSTPYSPILYGKYTKTGDNTYVLEGFGSVEVVTDGNGNAVSLKITPTGGQATTYTATKLNKNLNSAMSNKLCRTWSIDNMRMYVKYNGKTMMDVSGKNASELLKNIEEWLKKNDPEYEEGDLDYIEFLDEVNPKQVVFTKTGTYMVYYENSEIAVSTWRWYNTAETVLQYSWDNDFDNEYGLNGTVDIEFRNNRLLMTEKSVESEDGETIESGLTYTMNEAK